MNITNARIMLIDNRLYILFVLLALHLLNYHLIYLETVIVLFKVVLLIFLSTDLGWSVTNSSKINTNFTAFCYFVDKLISAALLRYTSSRLPKVALCCVRYISS
jgi:hypothetical protein